MPRRAAPAAALSAFSALSALSVLLGALLLLCARPGEAHAVAAAAVRGPAAAAPAVDHAASRTPAGPHAVCAAPGELPGCSPFSHVTPGVLPAPPPAVPVTGAAGSPVARPADGAGPLRAHDAPARAPDLHALQVLRS
ncbi:hypothetical protein ABZ924_10090 [Streptomyces sp. NPDC046876]|uniref:hypothetical protein n=1 Tax=Streptomyces sp. NPDC046876 TaxID=3155616 RepID=UPI0033DEFBDC